MACLDDLIFLTEGMGASAILADENGTISYISPSLSSSPLFRAAKHIDQLPFGQSTLQKLNTMMDSSVDEPITCKDILLRSDSYADRVLMDLTFIRGKTNESQSTAIIVNTPSFSTEEALQNKLFMRYAQSSDDGIIVIDRSYHIFYANTKVSNMMTKYHVQNEAGLIKILFHHLSKRNRKTLIAALKSHSQWRGEITINHAHQTPDYMRLTLNVLQTDSKEMEYFFLRVEDIANIVKTREKLEYEATHDMLTDLPNRTLLLDRLEQSIRSMKRSGGRGALLFIDIDDFKDVNDLFGHEVGDQLLQTIAERLRSSIRSSDTLGRYGGDEFLLIIENIYEFDEVFLVIQKLKEQFEVPVEINGAVLKTTFSIGVAMIPDDGFDAKMLIDAADKAMYSVKQNGKDGFDFVKKEHSVISNDYFTIQRSTKNALKQRSFEIVYQPQFSIKDGRVTGAEALLRCTDDSIKDFPINKIIKVAEESGVIHEIGQFVLESVSRQLEEWRDISVTPIRIAINLSRKELGNDKFEMMVRREIEENRVSPEEIEFEITESTLMSNSEKARKNIESLRDIGFQFSIDDFGTGYSSLSNLKEFNLDKLKIDKSFIEALPANENDQAIVSATISMAKKLGLKVVAEGVETSTQDALLKDLECDEVQGFYYSHPVHPQEITEILMARNA